MLPKGRGPHGKRGCAEAELVTQVCAPAGVTLWQEGKASVPSPELPDAGWWQGLRHCMQAELPEPVHLEV